MLFFVKKKVFIFFAADNKRHLWDVGMEGVRGMVNKNLFYYLNIQDIGRKEGRVRARSRLESHCKMTCGAMRGEGTQGGRGTENNIFEQGHHGYHPLSVC